MPKVSEYSDEDIVGAIESLTAQGKRVSVASIAELTPVNRNRIQRIMTAWQKGKLNSTAKIVDIPESALAAFQGLLRQVIVQARESAIVEFRSQLEDAIALQTDIANGRDAALHDIEELKKAKEEAEKRVIVAQASAEESIRQSEQLRLEAKEAEDRAARAEERVKMSDDLAQRTLAKVELAEKKAEDALQEVLTVKQDAAHANAIAKNEKDARERAELAYERAEESLRECSAATAAATAKAESLAQQLADAIQRAERAEAKNADILKDMSVLRGELSGLKERYDHTQESLRKAEAAVARLQAEAEATNSAAARVVTREEQKE